MRVAEHHHRLFREARFPRRLRWLPCGIGEIGSEKRRPSGWLLEQRAARACRPESSLATASRTRATVSGEAFFGDAVHDPRHVAIETPAMAATALIDAVGSGEGASPWRLRFFRPMLLSHEENVFLVSLKVKAGQRLSHQPGEELMGILRTFAARPLRSRQPSRPRGRNS